MESLPCDAQRMRQALVEARRAIGKTGPNPAVGAIIVRGGRIVSRGFHRCAGAPHAEIEALSALANSSLARGATLYVTLEPCSTTGRTPPCTEAIRASGIARVVFGATDPNPKHAGRATHILRHAGIAVTPGVMEPECQALNEAWNHWIASGLPFVTIKAGLSLDGRISSPPDRRWITSPAARADAMRLRAACDAILVGGETVRTDNPRLTVRGIAGANPPLRAVWTRSGRLPTRSLILTDGLPTRVFKGVSLRTCLCELARAGVQSVLIEGGGRTLGEALDRNLANRAVFYMAPVILGGPVPAIAGHGAAHPLHAPRLENPEYQLIGGNLRISGTVVPTLSRGVPAV